MCSKFYGDCPAMDEVSLGELVASVRAVDRSLSPQEEALIGVLHECSLVKENYFPPQELLAEARRLGEKYPHLAIH